MYLRFTKSDSTIPPKFNRFPLDDPVPFYLESYLSGYMLPTPKTRSGLIT